MQPVYPQPVQVQGQQQIFVSPNMNHPFAPVHQGQQRGNFYAQPQFITLQQPHMMYPTSQGGMNLCKVLAVFIQFLNKRLTKKKKFNMR